MIDARIDQVWQLQRDFSAISQWLPGVASSIVDKGGAPNQVGSTRALTFADGGKMRERLLAPSDTDKSVTFAIIESELPIENYVSTIHLRPITDGNRSFISWTGEFDVVGDQAEEMRRRMQESIYQPGFDSLKKRFGSATA